MSADDIKRSLARTGFDEWAHGMGRNWRDLDMNDTKKVFSVAEMHNAWLSAVLAGMEIEREACAKACDAEANKTEADGAWLWEARRCAAAIRARGQA